MAEYIDRMQLETDTEWSEYDDDFISYSKSQINSLPTADVIPIPEGATNGDVIKAMFPQWDLREEIGYEYKLFGETHKFEGLVDEDWWNSPYHIRNNKGV